MTVSIFGIKRPCKLILLAFENNFLSWKDLLKMNLVKIIGILLSILAMVSAETLLTEKAVRKIVEDFNARSNKPSLSPDAIFNRLETNPKETIMKLNKMIQLGKSSNNTCPNVEQKPNCTETQSTCWAPGTEDVDCPLEDGSGEFGLCCFDGCRNTCLKQCVEVRNSIS